MKYPVLISEHTAYAVYKPGLKIAALPQMKGKHVTRVNVARLHNIRESDLLSNGFSARRLGELLEPLERKAKPRDQHWITFSDDEGESFCRRCAENEIKKLTKKYPDGGFCLGGGYSCECDSSKVCAKCGALLDYTLTDYGIESELDHFCTHGVRATPMEAYCFLTALSWHGNPIVTESVGEFHYKPEWGGRLAKLCFRFSWDLLHAKQKNNLWEQNPKIFVASFTTP